MKKSQLNQLAEVLPPFNCSDGEMSEFIETSNVQQYLNFYGINFSKEIPGVKHRFTSIQSAEYKIAVQCWSLEKSKGTIFLAHGYLDHTGVFGHAIRYALKNNYSVCAFDLPGHGLSSGEAATISSFDKYTDALQAVYECVSEDTASPFHVLAQSTGGSVVLNYLWRYGPSAFDKVILLAPLIRSHGWGLTRLAFFFLKPILKNTPRHFNENTHNKKFIDFLREQDPLQSRVIPTQWVGAMSAWWKKFINLPALEKSVLVVQGDADTTVDWPYNMRQIKSRLPNATITIVPELRHQIVNESDSFRASVFTEVTNFLNL